MTVVEDMRKKREAETNNFNSDNNNALYVTSICRISSKKISCLRKGQWTLSKEREQLVCVCVCDYGNEMRVGMDIL